MIENLPGIFKVRMKVGAEIELGSACSPGGGGREELRLYNAVFLMPELRPGIREEDKQIGKRGTGWECLEEETRFGPQKEKIIEPRAVALPQGAFDAFTYQIDADTAVLRMILG